MSDVNEQAAADAAAEAHEAEVAADKAQEPESTEYIEFVGVPPITPEFVKERIITRREAKDGWDISIPKDLVWTKGKGKLKGRMLIPTADLTPETVEMLVDVEEGFKLVRIS